MNQFSRYLSFQKSQLFHSNNNVSWVRAHLLLFLIAISFVRSICQINHGKQTVSPSRNNNPRVAKSIESDTKMIVGIAILFAQHAHHLHDKVDVMLSLSCTTF